MKDSQSATTWNCIALVQHEVLVQDGFRKRALPRIVTLAVVAGLFALPCSALAAGESYDFAGDGAVNVPRAEVAQANAEGFGPLDPTPPTGTTVAQLIERMGKREMEFAAAREAYIFRQTVKVDTISDDTNRADGEYQQVTDITFSPGGKREEHVVFAPQNTLERVMMSPADFKDIEQRLPFVLTSEQLPQYDMTYLGRQKVDELDTYVFDVKPKVLEKGHRYFQGKVWIDQQDFQIVVVNGLNVPQDTRRGHEDLSPPFTTYYQQIDGKYWFPTYTKMEGNLHFAAQDGAVSNDVHMKSIVRYSDYKRFRSTVTIHYNGEDISNQPTDTAPAQPAATTPPAAPKPKP